MPRITLRLDEKLKRDAESLARSEQLPLAVWIRNRIGGRTAGEAAFESGVDTEREPMVHLGLRLKKSEFEALRESARRAGMTNQRYLIAALRYFTASENAFSAEDVGALREAGEALSRVGTNLNQISRNLNAAAKRGEPDPESWGRLGVLLPQLEKSISDTTKLLLSVLMKTRWRTKLKEGRVPLRRTEG